LSSEDLSFRKLFNQFRSNLSEIYQDKGLFVLVKHLLKVFVLIEIVSFLYLLAYDPDLDDFWIDVPAILTVALFGLALFGFALLVPPNLGQSVQSTCVSEFGSDYVNYSGVCLHENEAARKLAGRYPENYSIVSDDMLKDVSGLDWMDLQAVESRARDLGLIYCYWNNTGFLSNQRYCKQAHGDRP